MIIRLSPTETKNWNDALNNVGVQGTIFQSTYWAEYLYKTYNDHPIYLASINKKGDFNGILLAMESCYAKHPALTMANNNKGLVFSKIYQKFLSPIFHKILPFIYWENGPIILPEPFTLNKLEKESLYRDILNKIAYIADEKCYEIKFARPPFFDDQNEAFTSLNFNKIRMGTFLVDVEKPIDTIQNDFNRELRRKIRRANDNDVQVIRIKNESEINNIYKLFISSARRTETKHYPLKHYLDLWKFFKPLNKIEIFTAYTKEIPIATALCLIHNKIVHLFRIGDSDYARMNKIPGNEAVWWSIIQWGHDNGFKYFDLSGVQIHKIDEDNQKAKGIFRFKSKWGGQLIEYNDYHKIIRKRQIKKYLDEYFTDSVTHN